MKQLSARLIGFVAPMLVSDKALAVLSGDPGSGISGLATGTGTEGIRASIVHVVNTVLDFVLIVAVVYVIAFGIGIIVSGGNEDSRKPTLIYYVIAGILIILLARVIVTFVNNLL